MSLINRACVTRTNVRNVPSFHYFFPICALPALGILELYLSGISTLPQEELKNTSQTPVEFIEFIGFIGFIGFMEFIEWVGSAN